jgi:chromosome segregation ATPase
MRDILAGMRFLPAAVVAVPLAIASLGCRSAYYKTMESLGVHKREILVDRVEEARDEQQDAKSEFVDALTRFKELTGYTGGDLEDVYEDLNGKYEDCASQAQEVTERIDAVDEVAGDLFDEWREELKEYEDPDLRRQSEAKLDTTQKRCRDLVATMRRAEKAMKPVLSALHDRVLFLKHNLNAQAIASLQGQAIALEGDVSALVEKMEAAIREANAFLDTLPES